MIGRLFRVLGADAGLLRGALAGIVTCSVLSGVGFVLLKSAPIVLLDEATAALDAETEVAVQNAIESLRHRRTVIVIAHRLQTVTAADRIFVLGDGAVVEAGSHDELLALAGRYASFWHERSRAAGWRLAGPAD